MSIRPWPALFLSAGILACAQDRQYVLSDGRALTAITTASDSLLLLIVDPGDCFSCSPRLSNWTLAYSAGKSLSVVLSRSPNQLEQQALARMRVPLLGSLKSVPNPEQFRPPMLLLFVNGKEVLSEALPPGTTIEETNLVGIKKE